MSKYYCLADWSKHRYSPTIVFGLKRKAIFVFCVVNDPIMKRFLQFVPNSERKNFSTYNFIVKVDENYSNCLLNPSKAIISEACSNKVTCCVLFQVRLRQQFPWRSSLVPVVHLESKACRLLRDHQSSPHSSRIFLDLTDHPTDNSSGGVTCTEIIYNSWLNTGSPPRIH